MAEKKDIVTIESMEKVTISFDCVIGMIPMRTYVIFNLITCVNYK